MFRRGVWWNRLDSVWAKHCYILSIHGSTLFLTNIISMFEYVLVSKNAENQELSTDMTPKATLLINWFSLQI